MNKIKKLGVALFFVLSIGFSPSLVSAEEGRYFVKSTKNFWKSALNARHSFDNGFTADLTDFQVKFNRVLGLEIEPVKIFQILPADPKISLTPEPRPTPSPSFKPKTSVKNKRSLPTDQTPWGVETIYNDVSIEKTSGGDNLKVAVLDTGVNVNHPDLKNNIGSCKDLTKPRLAVVEGKCEDKNGHGTHVTGIIGADGGVDRSGIYGVVPKVSLLVYKVCDNYGLCFADDIATAIKMAADDGANIINLSFGSDSGSDLVKSALDYAVNKGVLPVAAAGNDGPFDASIDYPSAYPAVISVGAVNHDLNVTDWSARGINQITKPYEVEEKDIEFAAPGENIESTWIDGGYMVLSGTSMASPFIAGLAAKVWQSKSENPAQATRELLHKIAVDLNPAGDDNASGFGLPRLQTLTP